MNEDNFERRLLKEVIADYVTDFEYFVCGTS